MVTEYQQGTAFPGAVGRTADEWTPDGRHRPAPRRERPTLCSSSSTTWPTGSSRPFGALIDAPNLDWVAANGLSRQ